MTSPTSPKQPQQRQADSGQSIPLQNLARPPGDYGDRDGGHGVWASGSKSGNGSGTRAESQRARHARANLPGLSTSWEQLQAHEEEEASEPAPASVSSTSYSPLDLHALHYSLPPEINPPGQGSALESSTTNRFAPTPYSDEPANRDHQPFYSDSVPLTSSIQPISGALGTAQLGGGSRSSFQTVSDVGVACSRPPDNNMLGFDLETGYDANRYRNYGQTLAPGDGRVMRSPSVALHKAGSLVRAMSQRVVNISGEAENLDRQRSRSRSRSPGADGGGGQESSFLHIDAPDPTQLHPPSPIEKTASLAVPSLPTSAPAPVPVREGKRPMPNPLKGRSLGIFGPENAIRKRLCDLLVNAYLEPTILILIVLQAILLAVEASPNVFEGNPRPQRWGDSSFDLPMLVLFIIFTLELIARIIVSGFVLNATEYSTIDRSRGVRAAVADQYKAVFGPQRQKSVKGACREREADCGPATFARSITMMHGQRSPETVEEAQRMHLARRAFLRHGFNRLDFLAVLSYWITLFLSMTGLEAEHHLYVFRLCSSLRIMRLLALTNGTSIILRSLKKATPLLIRVSFLICFFWILFAIIGLQSFKTSLSRQCVWLDPLDPTNLTASYTNELTFCGGYLDNATGVARPWVLAAVPGTLDGLHTPQGQSKGKGYLCPRGSICLMQRSPYSNTVNFDDIVHSLELVFVIMSANTWSDIMYYTTNSDYLPAALFFAAGIMIMMLWMTNLLIAVITSSFQVIREESKSSAFTGAEDQATALEPEHHVAPISPLQRAYHRTHMFWVLVIAFDLVAQACRQYNMYDDRHQFIDLTQDIVTALLDMEIIVRFVADWRCFHRSKRNLFDLMLAVATSVILIPTIRNSGQLYAWLTVFQILRVYRVVMAMPMTRKLIKLVLGNAAGIANLMLFVFLMTFLMAVLAVQLFRGEIPMRDSNGELIEISFYNIYNAFLGMYQILSSENWTSILYNVTSYTTAKGTSWYGAVFLIGWFILAFFIIVNMFIAVIQENFDVSEDEKRVEQVRAFLQRKELGSNSSNLALSTIFAFGKKGKKRDPLDYGPATMEMLLKDAVVREFLDEDGEPGQQGAQTARDAGQQSGTGTGSGTGSGTGTGTGSGSESAGEGHVAGDAHPGPMSSIWAKVKSLFSSRDPNPFYSNLRFNGPNETLDPRQMARQAVTATSARRRAQREYLARHPTYNTALYLFKPSNPVRRLCQKLVGPGRGSDRFDGVEPNKIAWYTFSAFVYAAVVAMVVLACVTTPLYQKEYYELHPADQMPWFVWVDIAFALLFTVEAMLKVIADGWLFTPNAYFRSSWGIIDGIVLITLWINAVTLLRRDAAVSRVVGAFKALRALRLLNISDSARDTFHSLIIVGGWKILSAAFVSISLLIPFAVYALNLFNGQLVRCNDPSVYNLSDCVGEYETTPYSQDWPMLAPRTGSNPYFSFDDFGASLFILFQIVSQEGWVDVSFAAQAITGRDTQPRDGAVPGIGMFFVVFNLLSTVFILTLFISVFMRNYTEQTGVAFLTTEQRSWLELRKLLRQISPSKSSYDESESAWKRWCHKRAIQKRGKWYTAVTGMLVLHLVLLTLEFASEPRWWTRTRDVAFLLFTLLYMVNVVIRIVGLGWARFRRSSWDLFSLVSVFGACGTSVLLLSNTGFEAYIQLHKFFLVAIVLLLIPRNNALDQLFKTAAASLSTIINLLATWLVFFLVFAIALTQTFSLTRFGPGEGGNLNFRTVPKALILLLRMSCGEGWNEIMEDFAAIVPPFCVDSDVFYKNDCGSMPWARSLFIAWNLISMYIFVNLFISLIYESFSYVFQRSSGLAVVDRDEIRRFKEAWRSVDPGGTGFISKAVFPRLLAELSGVFEMRVYDAADSVQRILEDVQGTNETTRARHASMASGSAYTSINISRLNARLDQIDVQTVRERRRRHNLFFEEVTVSADPDRGISFTSVLMILAHYKIISDHKSLKLEEFLRRRAHLQRVEEEVRRRIVLGFFDTLYYSRKFREHINRKNSSRMSGVPQLGVPDIYVEDDDEDDSTSKQVRDTASDALMRADSTSSIFEAAADLGRRSGQTGDGTEHSAYGSDHHTRPPSLPQTTYPGPGHRSIKPTSGYDTQDSAVTPTDEGGRHNSSVSPAQVRDILNDSVWVESIRRSATVRRSPSNAYK